MKTLSLLSSRSSTVSLLAIAAAALIFSAPARADAFSTAIGGGVGAVAGAVIGDRVGGRDAAIIGSGVGGAIGAVVGQSVGQPAYRSHSPAPVYPAYAPVSRGYTIVQPSVAPVYYYPREVYYPAYRVEPYRGWGHGKHHHHRGHRDHYDRHDHHGHGRYGR